MPNKLTNMVKGAGVAGLVSSQSSNPDSPQSTMPAIPKESLQAKSYRIPAALARAFKKWAIDQHMTEQEAVALAMTRLMESYHENH